VITTPLALIVAFLRKHGASLACLEGAPMGARCDKHIAQARLLYIQAGGEPGTGVLYLGTGDICPAALGWAAQVLALAGDGQPLWFTDPAAPMLVLHGPNGGRSYRWTDGVKETWRFHDDDAWSGVYFPLPMPSTPAERLKAVIEYEVSR